MKKGIEYQAFSLGIVIFMLLLSVILSSFNLLNADEFIYNSHGKKDPFSPPVKGVGAVTDMELLSGIRLEGIVWDSKNPMAMVNDSIVAIGDEIAGAKVVDITKNEVIIEIDGQRVSLKLQIEVEGEI